MASQKTSVYTHRGASQDAKNGMSINILDFSYSMMPKEVKRVAPVPSFAGFLPK